jgi:hypothetical protein
MSFEEEVIDYKPSSNEAAAELESATSIPKCSINSNRNMSSMHLSS